MRLVIIGGDAAGMSAASQAKRKNPEAEVIVLEETQDVSYGACGLPYKLPDGQCMDDLRIISAERFRQERGLDLRLGHRVEQLSPETRTVRGMSESGPFELGYHKLIIATGARAIKPPIPGLDALWGQGAYPLKTLADGQRLKQVLAGRQPSSAIIIGGGYIGLEAAEGLHEQGLRLTIIEALPRLLPFVPDPLRERVEAEARQHEIALKTQSQVQRIERQASGSIQVVLPTETLAADLVLVATGVRPNAELAREAGLSLGAAGSIAVDAYLNTSAADILAAGDCADATHGLTGQSVWIPLALRANRAGKLAGENALGGHRAVPPVMGTAVFKFFALQIARTGLTAMEAEQHGFDTAQAQITASTRAHYFPGGGKLSIWLLADRKTHRLLGGAMVGQEAAAHKIDTLVAALHAGLTAEQLYDMDLAYAPPFGPSWSPLLTAASKLVSAIENA